MSYTTTVADLYLTPFKTEAILDVHIESKYNQHACMTITALVSENMRDSYIDIANSYTVLQLMKVNKEVNPDTGEKLDDIPLFAGYIKDIDISVQNFQYVMRIDVISCTHYLDIKYNSQTFQDINMTYRLLFESVLAKYKDMGLTVGFINAAQIDQKIGKLIIQYEETDWQFLKRVASLLFEGLLPAVEHNKPGFYIGIPYEKDAIDLNLSEYTYHRDILASTHSKTNHNNSLIHNAFTTYKVKSHEIISIGRLTEFKDIPGLYVRQYNRNNVKEVLETQYIIGQQQCFHQDCIYHKELIGLSLPAKVLKRENDKVFVHFFDIDKEQNVSTAYPFTYSTPYTADGNGGWYVMPEVGDVVRIYFPTAHEEDAFAMDSERQTNVGNLTDNPDVKYFRTAFGKEIVLAPDSLRISSKDGQVYIQMSDAGGILVYSSSNISIAAQGNVSVSAGKNMNISAVNDLVFTSNQAASIDVKSDITVSGNKIYEN